MNGRAYIGKMFLLNFTLYNKEIADRDGDLVEQDGRALDQVEVTEGHRVEAACVDRETHGLGGLRAKMVRRSRSR